MLASQKIQHRQSEIRQALASLVAKEKPSDDETRSMSEMDAEYRSNETRYRAALIAEDNERRTAGKDLETRGDREWGDLVKGFELTQVALALSERGFALSGKTNEVVTEMRSKQGYRGIPVPLMALEQRAGETVATGLSSPKNVQPIIDRLFPASVAGAMGFQLLNVDSGLVEYPVANGSVAAGWAATETGAVAGPTVYSTQARTVDPGQTLGITMKVTRVALKQMGPGLEDAIRRDMQGATQQALDAACFLGTGASGQPLGLIAGQATYGIGTTAVGAAATWAAFRAVLTTFLTANAATSGTSVRLLIRPEVWSKLDATYVGTTAVTELERTKSNIGTIIMSSNALAAPVANASNAFLTAPTAGSPPAVLATYGGLDMIVDPYKDAPSGMLNLTALLTADVTALRAAQSWLLTGVGN